MAEYDLFISYAEDDRAWVEGYLFQALNQANVQYFSEEAFDLGAPRLQEFERAIRQSQRTLLILSQAYMADSSNQFVVLLAQCFGFDTSTWPVIPLLLESLQLPPRLAVLVSLDATHPDRWEAAMSRLCKDIGYEENSCIESLPECPYPGMLPFTEMNSERFFGRDEEIEELLDRLRLSQFVTLIGPSGSGKSSLVSAGLVPALRRRNSLGSGERWLIRTFRPGETPLAELKRILETDNLENLSQTIAQLISSHSKVGKLLLIVDQFEELFTSFSGDLALSGNQESLEFQQKLLELMNISSFHIILTVRADFYADLMASPMWRAIKTHRMEISPLDEQGLREAIVRPAETVDVFVESALIERLVTDSAGEPGILPLVQETLVLIWSRLERRYLALRAYEALILPRKAYAYGSAENTPRTGLQVAISRRADATIGRLKNDYQEAIARRIFLRLIQFGEGRADTRRQQLVKALKIAKEDPSDFEQTLRHLVDNRLLTLSGEESIKRKADIAHEALISAWPMLRYWILEKREVEQTRRRLTIKAEEWIRLGKKEGGLLDIVALLEAEKWINSSEAEDLSSDELLLEFIHESRIQVDAKQRKEHNNQKRWTLVKVGIAIVITIGTTLLEVTTRARLNNQLHIISSSAMALLESGQDLDALLEALRAAQIAKRPLNLLRVTPDTHNKVMGTLQQATYGSNFRETGNQRFFKERNRLESHRYTVSSVRAAQDEFIASASYDKTIKIWDYQGKERQTLTIPPDDCTESPPTEAPFYVSDIDISSDSQVMISAGSLNNNLINCNILTWEKSEGSNFQLTNTIHAQQGSINSVVFSPKSNFILSAGSNGSIKSWDTKTGKLLRDWIAHTGIVTALDIDKEGTLASSGDDGSIKLWRVSPHKNTEIIDTEIILEVSAKEPLKVWDLSFSPDGTLIATAQDDGSVALWSYRPNSELSLIWRKNEHNSYPVRSVSFSPSGKRIVSGGDDGVLKVWDLDSNILQTLLGHSYEIRDIDFAPNNKELLLSSSGDNTVKIWDDSRYSPISFSLESTLVPPGYIDAKIKELIFITRGFKHSSDLIRIGGSKLVSFFRLEKDVPVSEPRLNIPHEKIITAISLDPDRKIVAVGDADGRITLLDHSSGKELSIPHQAHESSISSMSFDPVNQVLASGGRDRIVKLWKVDNQYELHQKKTFDDLDDGVFSIDFSPNGKYMAASGNSEIAWVWRLDGKSDGEGIPLIGHSSSIEDIKFHPKRTFIATASTDRTVKLWDFKGELISTMRGHKDRVNSVSFSSRGHVLFSGSSDRDIRIWSLEGLELSIFKGHPAAVMNLSATTDNRSLISYDSEGNVYEWNLVLNDLIQTGCNHVSEYLNSMDVNSQQKYCDTPIVR